VATRTTRKPRATGGTPGGAIAVCEDRAKALQKTPDATRVVVDDRSPKLE
jgi:hypothetical protein